MKLYNTLSRTKEEFTPIVDEQVSLYACGLTVYNEPHIGNWSSYIAWDVLVRFLRSEGYEVNHVQNYTDVGHLVSDDDAGEDKMITAAKREHKTAWDVAEYYILSAEKGMKDLNIVRPTNMPRATDYIPQQIAFVEALEKKGYAYIIKGEGVYFDTSKLSDYGKLARLDITGLKAGARVDVAGKRNITDFALWKFSPKDEQRDMEWDSKWGKGFPGWHLECSVMSRELLGDTIDIHTGGIDHIPVHHTNEIAQTEALTGKDFVHYWLHRNFIKVDGQKMSKSLGNVYTLKDLTEKGFDPLDFRMLILQSHYRTESNFSWELLEDARERRRSLQAFADLRFQDNPDASTLGKDYFKDLSAQVSSALNNDLNTPEVLAIVSQASDHIRSYGMGLQTMHLEEFTDFVTSLDNILGLGLLKSKDLNNDQKRLLTERQQARDTKCWTASDNLRDQLRQQGITIDDTNNGQVWSRV